MIREKSDPDSFIVTASIGHGELVKVGDRVDFEKSIAKYAVLNKSPLIVENIETDTRFGRANRTQYGSKSFVCMPIKTSKEILGVLTISRRNDAEVYTQNDVEILTPLLSNAAFTYENLRLIKENEIGTQRLQAVNNILKVVNSSIRGSELTHAILNEIQNVIPLICAMVLTIDESKRDCMRVFELFSPEPVDIAKGVQHQITGSIFDKVWKQKTALTIKDTTILGNDVEKDLLIHPGGKSAFLSPLKIDGVVQAVLVFLAGEPNGFYKTGDFLDWSSNLVSFALERNRLTAAVAKRDLEMATIRQIGSALAASTFDMDKVLNYTMDMIKEVMNAEAGSLMLIKGDELEFVHSFNFDIDVLNPFRLKLGQGIAGYAASSGQAVVENDVEASPHFYRKVDDTTGFQTRSVLCVPLISQGKVIGVIEVMNKIGGNFLANDVDLLQSIASSVSVAMENARLYKETVSMAENERDIRGVFQKFVPKEIVDQIIHGRESGGELMEEYKRLTHAEYRHQGLYRADQEFGTPKNRFPVKQLFFRYGWHCI
jgi:GAF domain-containing protein